MGVSMLFRVCRLAVASAVFSFLMASVAGTAQAAQCTFESFWSGGCNKEMERGIVKIFEGPEKFFYFFKSNQYVRNDANGDKWIPERTIGDNWKGLWHRDIDAAVNWGNGKTYFFRGSEYMRY